jgi:nucleotide-binding universal stress UspA family protein
LITIKDIPDQLKQKIKMKTILVAIDFSDASRKAAEYAAGLAKVYDAKLVLLHAFYMPFPVGDAPGYIPLSLEEIQQENEAFLQREIEYLAEQFQVKADGYVKMGMAAGVIKDSANEIKADLVIMGMKGAGQTGGIFGSTVIACIRKTKQPLLIIPQNSQFSSIQHISFAADFGNKTGTESYQILEDIVAKFNADIQVIHVQKNDGDMTADEVAGKLKAEMDLGKLKHTIHTVGSDNVEKGINDFIDSHPTDMLVMVAHHHSLFERWFGSIHTNLMAYHAHLPLLVLHD